MEDMIDPFDSCRRFAFRYEALGHYADDSSGRSHDLEYFTRYQTAIDGHNSDWAEMVSQARSRGASIMRLRVLASPRTPYEVFELKAGYMAGLRAGEDIRVIESGLIDRDFPDYWLYDNEIIEILHYGPHGEFIGSTVRDVLQSDLPMISDHRRLFEAATRLHLDRGSNVT